MSSVEDNFLGSVSNAINSTSKPTISSASLSDQELDLLIELCGFNNYNQDVNLKSEGHNVVTDNLNYSPEETPAKNLDVDNSNNNYYELEKLNIKLGKDSENGEKKFLCGECTQTFVLNSDLVKHTKRKHVLERERPYKCNTCGKSFYQRCELSRHGDMHNNEKYFCKFCPKYFSHSSYLNTHTLVHTEEKPVCGDCNKTFSTASYLRSHRKRVHGIIETIKKTRRRRQATGFKCKQCSFTGRQARDLLRHDAKEHTVKPDMNSIELPCEFCSQLFPRRKYLNAHRRTIHREKLVACENCSMLFSKLNNLNKHSLNSCKLTKKLKISSDIFDSDTKEEKETPNKEL